MRRTRITDEALLAIFEGRGKPKTVLPFAQPTDGDENSHPNGTLGNARTDAEDAADDNDGAPAPPPRPLPLQQQHHQPRVRTNTVASQCELDSAYMELCDVLIRSQQTGVLTAQHARERRAVQLWSEKLLLDARHEEKHQRDRIMAERRDMMELMRTMLLALAPTHTTRFNRGGAAGSSPRPTALVAIAARDSPPRAGSPSSLRILPPPPSSGSQQALLTVVGGAAASSSVVQFSPDGSAVAAAAEAELERLRDRVVQLERQLAQKMKLDWLVRPMGVAAAGGAGPPGGGPLLGGDGLLGSLPELAVDVAAIVGAFTRLEAEEREGIAEKEATAHAAIDSAHRLVLAEAKAVAQRRFLIQTPYEAYRPRIPIQHSLRGEEYLRRWLMAETFKHYEDVLGQLQRWENDVRCCIEEEAFALFPLMRAQVFEPLHVARCEVLEEELDDLRHLKIRHERAATVLATAEKLRLVCDTEARAREEIAYYARIDRQRIGEVASSLAVLKDVQRTADGLRAELGRATARHREEMVGLHQHLTALDEEGAARRLREGEEKFNAYLESAFVRGGGGVPLYESLASMRPPPTAAAIPIVPQPPSTAAAGPSPPTGSSRAPSLGGPRNGRRASHSTAALGAAVAVSSSSAAAASSDAGSSEAVGSARGRGVAAKSQLTPRRVANGNGQTNSDAKLTHAQQTKDIYSRPVHRRHSSSQQQQQRSSSKQKEGASSTGYWAGF